MEERMQRTMKYSLIQVLFLALAWSLTAADQILVEARLIEYPANESFTRKDWESGELTRRKGFEVLSAPKILIANGQSAFLTVGNQHEIPNPLAAGQTNLFVGVEFRILPNLNGDKVQFNAGLTLREHAGAQKEHGLDITEFVIREYYLSGTAQQGQTILFNPESYKNNRKLAVVMTLTKLADKSLEDQLDPPSQPLVD